MKRGLVIGKFYPPHKGHHFLIETALAESDQVDVLVCDSPRYNIGATTRAQWLQKIHPTTNVRVITDLDDDDNSKAWATHTINFLGYAPDVVFTSEDYGDTYAHYMQCKHRKVDKERKTVPISGTEIRKNPTEKWQYMKPRVRARFCKRICVLGAESTGTTTLSKALAEHYRALWVPEVGRSYSESILATDHQWEHEDFLHIAKLQTCYEDIMAGLSNGLLICDTNAFATEIWEERYLGTLSPEMERISEGSKAALYIVTGDEIPFIQDGIRDGEHIRHAMHDRFIEALTAKQLPYLLVRGSVNDRLQQAITAIDTLIQQKVTI